MKKSILLVLLIAFLAVAVGVSGCLDNDNGNNTTNNSTNNTTNNSTNNSTPSATFDGTLVTVDPVPSGFELLAVKNVTADQENINGITDALNGFSGYYAVNNSNVYLSAYQTENNSTAKAYVQTMIDAHKEKYPGTNNVTTVQINGHDATLFTTVSQDSTSSEKYVLTWAAGDKLIIVNGPATYDQIKTIAEASKL